MTICGVFIVGVTAALHLSLPARAVSNAIVLSEVMTGHTDGQSKEFVELYNNSDQPVVLDGWAIEYKSASGQSWSKRATLGSGDILAAHDYVVISTEALGSKHLSSGMAQDGGNIRLQDSDNVVVDQLAWGSGDSPEGQALMAPALGQSMARSLSADGAQLVDTDNNAADFHLASNPTEGAPPTGDNEVVVTDPPPVPGPTGMANIVLNELLPDPQTPLSDSKDEYIELYNDSDVAASLEGWSLRDKTNHVFKLGQLQIDAHGYVVLKSAVTKISLNNDGDEISLIDPSGTVVDSSPNYGNAKPGLTWGLSDGVWAWLSEPTPGSSNAAPIVITTATTSEKKAAAKKTSNSKASSTKAKVAAKKAKKPSGIAKAASNLPGAYAATEVAQNPKLWSWLLIALGAGTIGYGIYAYRPEITHFIHQLRAKFSAR